MSPGAWVLLAAVGLALAFGGYRLATDGRFRGTHRVRQPDVPEIISPAVDTVWHALVAAVPEAVPGSRATLVQFSSAFCAPCRATRRVLGEVAELVPGVVHIEIDAEHHLDLVRRLGVLRTPTTLVLDSAGVETSRASGAPHRNQVLATLSTM